MAILINQSNAVKKLKNIYFNNNGTRKQIKSMYVNRNNASKTLYPDNQPIYQISTYKATKYKEYKKSMSIRNGEGAAVYGSYTFNENTGLFTLSNDITDSLEDDGDGYYSLPSGTTGYISPLARPSTTQNLPAIALFSSATYDSWYNITCMDCITALPIQFLNSPTVYFASNANWYPNNYKYKDSNNPGLYYAIETYDEEDAAYIYYPGKVVYEEL